MSTTDAVNNLASIKRTTDVSPQTTPVGTAMDQQAFLKLFTTQLRNQNPLDPMKNEDFVAQLAQFSQLEATTNMASTLKSYVASSASERILNGAGLIGKKVPVPGAPALWTAQENVSTSVALSSGTQGLTIEVLDDKGQVVRTQTFGAQTAGTLNWDWNGLNDAGQAAPVGVYTLRASAVVDGKNTSPEVAVLATVQSVTQSGSDGSLQLQVSGGRSIALSNVQRISQ